MAGSRLGRSMPRGAIMMGRCFNSFTPSHCISQSRQIGEKKLLPSFSNEGHSQREWM